MPANADDDRFWFLGRAALWIATRSGAKEDLDIEEAAKELFAKLDTEEGFIATAYPRYGENRHIRSPLPQEIWSRAGMDPLSGVSVVFPDDVEKLELGGVVTFNGKEWFGARVEREAVMRLWPALDFAVPDSSTSPVTFADVVRKIRDSLAGQAERGQKPVLDAILKLYSDQLPNIPDRQLFDQLSDETVKGGSRINDKTIKKAVDTVRKALS